MKSTKWRRQGRTERLERRGGCECRRGGFQGGGRREREEKRDRQREKRERKRDRTTRREQRAAEGRKVSIEGKKKSAKKLKPTLESNVVCGSRMLRVKIKEYRLCYLSAFQTAQFFFSIFLCFSLFSRKNKFLWRAYARTRLLCIAQLRKIHLSSISGIRCIVYFRRSGIPSIVTYIFTIVSSVFARQKELFCRI